MPTSKLAVLLITLAISGCNAAVNMVNTPDPQYPAQGSYATDSHLAERLLWGFWNVSVDVDGNVRTAFDRSLAMHFNTVRFMEETPCNDCLTISNLQVLPNSEISLDLTLRHPFAGKPQFTGFDVRGIVITPSDYAFPDSGLNIAWELDNLLLRNYDGYTNLFNPVDFPQGSNPAVLTYYKGNFAVGDNLTGTLNSYIAFCEDAPRRIFNAGEERTEQMILRLPGLPFSFGYAVDSNWFPVDGPVTDPLNDFPPEANCLEAFQIETVIVNELPSETWGYIPVQVQVSDHQGLETIASVGIESPELYTGVREMVYKETSTEGYHIYEGTIFNELDASPGYYPLLIGVEDTGIDPNLGVVNAWDIGYVRVTEGWAQTWGGTNNAVGDEIETDIDGNVYVSGAFSNTVDFDPGLGGNELTAVAGNSVFLSKFDETGMYEWTATWGTEYWGSPCIIAVSGTDVIYVAGTFRGSVDLDPGPGTDLHSSETDSVDLYLLKLDSNGNFTWGLSWGNGTDDVLNGIDTDSLGNVYLAGTFEGSIDLDPGHEADDHTSAGYTDAYMSGFDTDGNLIWALTWGGVGTDTAVDLMVDDFDNIFVHGRLAYTVDLDPGPGIDEVNGGQGSVYLSRFDTSGNYHWNSSWFKTHGALCHKMAHDNLGNIYFTGGYLAFLGQTYLFVRKLDSMGNGLWELSWGQPQPARGDGISVDQEGNVYITGLFSGTVDLDPGPGFNEVKATNSSDAYMIKLDRDGYYIWGIRYESSYSPGSNELGPDVAVYMDSIYVSGVYNGIHDLDPGSGEDWHISTPFNSAYLSKFKLNGQW